MKEKQLSFLAPYLFFGMALSALLMAAYLNLIISTQKTSSLSSSPVPSQEEVRALIVKNLSFYGIDPSIIQGYRDRSRVLHLKIDLSLDVYRQLEQTLEENLAPAPFSVMKREERQDSKQSFFLWDIKARDEENVVLLFSCPREASEGERVSEQGAQKSRAAIIIDDMGYSLDAIEEICSLNKPVTISVLPFSPHASRVAQIAHEKGLEVMLHLPLQSANNNGENSSTGIILSSMSEEEVRKTLDEDLSQVPYIKGVNNHMGSRITADKTLMPIILERIKQMNLFFVDSVTTTKSVAFRTAQKMGIASAYRHIFLDSIVDRETIKKNLVQLFRLAKRETSVVGICHPFEATLQVLKENIHLADDYKVELVFASQIVSTWTNSAKTPPYE